MAIPGFVRASLASKDCLTLQLTKAAQAPQQLATQSQAQQYMQHWPLSEYCPGGAFAKPATDPTAHG